MIPHVLVVMGVSGSGKSTIGALIAEKLGWTYADADDFHSLANVAKQRAGIPLDDTDRAPWLASIATWIDEMRGAGRHGVVTCSALRRRYRDVLIGPRDDVRLVYLQGSQALITARQAARHGHFMPASLMHSQFEVLEEPGPDEAAIVVSVAPAPDEVAGAVADAVGRLA